ncbi:hypothetical protein HOLleu_39596 [Holothuria leucospilota]|uniref:Immunoglobulin domain-containing protein n=1 Tax=Holothuria leucospilota TaxID=206669 RepID=A0A9Q0YGF0_HOLLE|nr:hypothetical protein HOLleu_39596 [Holothuria leucospilota]
MEARHIKHVIFIFGTLLCSVNTADKCLFGTLGTICYVTEGGTIQLFCRKNNSEPVIIYKDVGDDGIIIVKDNILKVQTGGYRYQVMENGTEKHHRLTINNISRSHRGRYDCLQTETKFDRKTVTLKVFYPPSEASCETDFDLFTTFEKDKIHIPFEGKCTVKDGYPSVNMSFSGILDSFEMKPVIKRWDEKIEGRFSLLPNMTLNNSVVSCIVRQHYPTHSTLPDYESVCSFKPFRFLAELSVWITPSNVTIHQPKDIYFVCSSNAENVAEVYWVLSKLPTGVSHSENSNMLTLHIRAEDTLTDRSIVITIKCQGHYRNRSCEDEAFVKINVKRG